MSTSVNPVDEPAWRRRLGSAANNRGWSLAEKLSRSVEEDDEMPALRESLGHAIEAIDFAQENGIDAAMNKFN